jgi:hypothetical protein
MAFEAPRRVISMRFRPPDFLWRGRSGSAREHWRRSCGPGMGLMDYGDYTVRREAASVTDRRTRTEHTGVSWVFRPYTGIGPSKSKRRRTGSCCRIGTPKPIKALESKVSCDHINNVWIIENRVQSCNITYHPIAAPQTNSNSPWP